MPKTNQGFSKIDKLIFQAAKNHNLQSAMDKQRVIRFWPKTSSAFMEDSDRLTKALDFKAGVLTVACLTLEIAQAIKAMAKRIIEALNEALGRQLVYAISVEV